MWRRQLKLGLEEIISYTFIFEKKMVLYFLACGILVPWPGIESLPPIMETLSFNPSVCVLVTQLCPTLCDPMDCSPPDSSVHGILQARILEQVAIPFSRGSFQPKNQTQVFWIAGRFFTVSATRETLYNSDLQGIPKKDSLKNLSFHLMKL